METREQIENEIARLKSLMLDNMNRRDLKKDTALVNMDSDSINKQIKDLEDKLENIVSK